MIGFSKNLVINKDNVEAYDVIDESSRKSAASVAGRVIVGSLFGGIGVIAGALSAKSKGVHIVALSFNDGKKSLIEVDDKIYKSIMKVLF